jgi:hypothetical protein
MNNRADVGLGERVTDELRAENAGSQQSRLAAIRFRFLEAEQRRLAELIAAD